MRFVALTFLLVACVPTNGLIVPAQDAAPLYRQFGGANPGVAYWTPSVAQVRRFEGGLAAYLRTQSASPHDLWKRLAHYRRQYVGVTIGGRRVIWAVFFDESLVRSGGPKGQDWKSGPPDIDDGGDLLFRIRFDVQTREYFDFQTNGIA